VALIVIAFFANLTALQRLVHIWRSEKAAKWNNLPPDIPHE